MNQAQLPDDKHNSHQPDESSSKGTLFVFVIGGLFSFCVASFLWLFFWNFRYNFLYGGPYPGIIGAARQHTQVWVGIPVIGIATSFLFLGIKSSNTKMIISAIALILVLIIIAITPIIIALWSWDLLKVTFNYIFGQ